MTEITRQTPELDLIWGAHAIGKVIGRSTRSTFGLLEKGMLPARKISGRWVIDRSDLIEMFTETPAPFKNEATNIRVEG
jgi:hypothetical protein